MVTTPDFSALPNWRKSRHSGQNSACIEVASGGGIVGVRDSKDLPGPVRAYDADTWREFTARIAGGWQPAS
jgi:uncharacterized protein DUF397